MLLAPTYSAHLYESAGLLVPRGIFEDSAGYVPDATTEANYADRVDEERGIVFGVKILGTESRNTPRTIGETYETVGEYIDTPYCYSVEALRDAIPLFEGIKVLIDHPDFQYTRSGERFASAGERSVKENFGRIVNVRVTSDGMYGDHEYLKSEPFSAKYVEVVKRMPNVLAFSPAANGVLRVVNAKPTIIKITDVRSVDLVGERPGTTSSLFESESKPMADTATMEPEKKTYEDDAPVLTPGATPMAETDDVPTGEGRDHFDAAFEKEVIDIWNGEGTAQEKAKKISQLAKKQDEIAGIRGSEDTSPDEETDDDLDLEETEANPAAASSSAAVGQDKIDPSPKSVTETDCGPANDQGAKDAKMHETVAKLQKQLHETTAKLTDATKKLTTAKARLKQVRADAESREQAIFESADLLNAAGKPVRSITLKATAGLPDRKARERFIAESVAARPIQAPKSEAPAARPLHETTNQQTQPGNKAAELVAKGDGAEIAAFLRS